MYFPQTCINGGKTFLLFAHRPTYRMLDLVGGYRLYNEQKHTTYYRQWNKILKVQKLFTQT